MILQQTLGPFPLKINSATERVMIRVAGWELARLYVVGPEGVTFAAAIFDVKQGVVPSMPPVALDSTQTLGPGDDTTTQIDVTTIPYLWVTSNTVEGSGTSEVELYCVVAREV